MRDYIRNGEPYAEASLRHKRVAKWAERSADKALASTEPWWLGNVRVYQNMMVTALKQRNRVIREYLELRASR